MRTHKARVRNKEKEKEIDEMISKTLSEAELTPRTKYAMNMKGILYNQIKEMSRSDFNNPNLSTKQQDITYEFYSSHRLKYLQELYKARNYVIKQRLCDESLMLKEEKEHFDQLLAKEERKFEKLMKRQDKETKRLLNEQMDEMEKFESQKHKFDKYNEKQARKAQELQQLYQKKAKKKQETVQRRKNAELKSKELEKEKFLESLRQRKENERRLHEDAQKRHNAMQEMLQKRVRDYDARAKKVTEMNQELEAMQVAKTQEIDKRYYNELERYHNKINEKITNVRSKRNVEFARHYQNMRIKKEKDNEKLRQLRQRQKENEERLKQFQQRKENELNRKKQQRIAKIASRLDNARGGEQARLKKIENDAKRAEANRIAFLKKKQEEDRLKHFVSNLKKQAMMEQVEQNARAKAFKNEQLMEKARREDERRIADLQLKEYLRNQRIMNDTQVKIRQTQLKEDMIEANKSGDIDKLKEFLKQVEKESEMRSKATSKQGSIMTSPLRSARKHKIELAPSNVDQNGATTDATNNESQLISTKGKNKKVSIVNSAKHVDSSVVRSNHLNKTAIKASMLRSS